MQEVHHLLNKVITFTDHIVNFDLPFEPGMKATVIAAQTLGNSVTVAFSFTEFMDYNLSKEDKTYYDNGIHKKWHELDSFPRNGVVVTTLSNDPEQAPFTLDVESVSSLLKSLKPINYLITIIYQSNEIKNISYSVKSYPGENTPKPMIDEGFLTFKKDNIAYYIPESRVIEVQIMPLVEATKNSTKSQDKT